MTQLEVIKKFVGALNKHDYTSDGGEDVTMSKNILDQAIRACSNYDGVDDAISKFLADAKAAPDSDTFLMDVCGINVHNQDTGGITGFDTGISKVERTSDTTVW